MLFATKHKNPSVSVFATHFKIGSGGQELMMNFLFIYILTLLTGKFEMGRALKQLPEHRQVTENRPQWRGKKIDSGCDVLCGQLIPSDSLSRGGVRNRGTRDEVFVVGLLTGTLARGHLGTEQQINFPFCVHCTAESSQLPGTPNGCGHLLPGPGWQSAFYLIAKSPHEAHWEGSGREQVLQGREPTSHCWLMVNICCPPLWGNV